MDQQDRATQLHVAAATGAISRGSERCSVSVAPSPHCVACRSCDPVRQDEGQPINFVMWCIGAALGA